LTVAPALLDQVPLVGRVVTGDALYCQRSVCQQILDDGGDYLIGVKENQPELFEEIALLFAQPPPGEVFTIASQHDKGHGRREWSFPAIVDTETLGMMPREGVHHAKEPSPLSGGLSR
jgi:hypothetical protein